MSKQNRIKATLSNSQWEVIYSKFKGLNNVSDPKLKKKALQSHINSELKKIASQIAGLPDSEPCVACNHQVSVGLPHSSFDCIDYIAKKTGVSDPGAIVSKFILNPLLIKD